MTHAATAPCMTHAATPPMRDSCSHAVTAPCMTCCYSPMHDSRSYTPLHDSCGYPPTPPLHDSRCCSRPGSSRNSALSLNWSSNMWSSTHQRRFHSKVLVRLRLRPEGGDKGRGGGRWDKVVRGVRGWFGTGGGRRGARGHPPSLFFLSPQHTHHTHQLAHNTHHTSHTTHQLTHHSRM